MKLSLQFIFIQSVCLQNARIQTARIQTICRQACVCFALVTRRVKGWGLLLLIIAATAPARAETSSVTVKFDDYGRMMIPVKLQGASQEQYYLFDTAARRNLILKENSHGPAIKLYKKGTLRHFSSEGLLRLPAATIEQWQVGGRTVKQSIAGLYVDSGYPSGMVGNTVFRGRILHWKPGGDRLNVYTNSAPLAHASWHNIGGRPNRHFSMLLTTNYRGQDITVLVSTGTSKTLLNVDLADKIFPRDKVEASKIPGFQTVAFGLSSPRRRYSKVKLPNFKIGWWDLGDIEVLSAHFDTKEITGLMNAPVMILGSDILMQNEIAFDFRDYQLWVKDEGARTISDGTTPPTQ